MVRIEEAFKAAADFRHEEPPWARAPPQPPPNLPEITQQAIDVYMLSQGPRGGIRGIGWWQFANGFTAIALHDSWSGTKRNYERLADALRKCEGQHTGFINEYNDDTLWWGICCIHVYNIGGDTWFLDKARGIYHYIRSKDSVCGRGQKYCCDMDMEGGCYWTTKPDEGYLNSISTGLFAELCARLALVEGTHGGGDGRVGGGDQTERHPHLSKLRHILGGSDGTSQRKPGGDEYMESARCSLGWILRCVYRPNDAVVMDGLQTKKQTITNWTFTYTTGVAIGVSALLYELTREEEYLTLSCHMAYKAMRRKGWIVGDGSPVLTDMGAWGKAPGEPAKNGDGVGFKGVLVRHLGTLYDVIQSTGASDHRARDTARFIKAFMNVNFASQLQLNTNGQGQYGPWWAGPFQGSTSHSQLPVLDLMATVMLVNKG